MVAAHAALTNPNLLCKNLLISARTLELLPNLFYVGLSHATPAAHTL